jgi:hypothetical protein
VLKDPQVIAGNIIGISAAVNIVIDNTEREFVMSELPVVVGDKRMSEKSKLSAGMLIYSSFWS